MIGEAGALGCKIYRFNRSDIFLRGAELLLIELIIVLIEKVYRLGLGGIGILHAGFCLTTTLGA